MDIFAIFQRVLITDFLRYFIPASGAFILFWLLLRKHISHRFIQRRKPENKRLILEFAYSMSTVLIFAFVGVGVWYGFYSEVFTMYGTISDYGWFYFGFSIVFMIIFHDFYFYWTHRWMHHPKIFRHVHLIHHKSTSPSPWAAYSFHPFEAIVQALVLPIMLFIIPVHHLAIISFLLYMILRNVWGHLGYELFPKGFIRFKWLNWFTTTTHHSLHHQDFNSNYGLYFTWWDSLMNTEHDKYVQRYEEVTSRTKGSATVPGGDHGNAHVDKHKAKPDKNSMLDHLRPSQLDL